MAKRKRNIRERQDYRQGGRVALARGGKRGAKRKATPKIRKPVEDPRPAPQTVGPSDKPIIRKPVKPTVRPSKKPVVSKPVPFDPNLGQPPKQPTKPQVPVPPPVEPTVSRPADQIDRDGPYVGEPQPTIYDPEPETPAALFFTLRLFTASGVFEISILTLLLASLTSEHCILASAPST